MTDIQIHTVILYPTYAKPFIHWLERFVFRATGDGEDTFVFSCFSFQVSETGLVEFEVLLKKVGTNAERQRVLLPLHAVAAILPDESRKNQFGFHQEESHGSNS